MAGIDEVFERLVVDDDFRAALARDPDAALLDYDLTGAEVALLASRLDGDDGGQRAVEQRTSKSALLAALGMLGDSEATDGIGADERLAVAGDPTADAAPGSTQVPAPPAPPVPVPYPNMAEAEAEVAIESIELSTEGIDVDDAEPAAVRPRKYGDITLKRGLTDDAVGAPSDDLAVPGDGGEAPGDAVSGDDLAVSSDDVEAAGEDLAVLDGDAAVVDGDVGDGQADVVTGAGPGARPSSPEQDDDVFEIADANEAGGRGP